MSLWEYMCGVGDKILAKGNGYVIGGVIGLFIGLGVGYGAFAPRNVYLMDLDKDGKVDIVVQAAKKRFDIFLNQGDDKFSKAKSESHLEKLLKENK